MKDRPFADQSVKPSDQALQGALGSAYPSYREVVVLASSFSQDWTFAKSSGWMLKISDRKKALLYLIPLNDGFRISVAVREDEREAFLQDDELAMMRDKISASRKYPEGFALQFDVTNERDFQPLTLLIRKLIALRA